ncbi:MAG: amidohydrolase [Anaerolineae bacterium]|nr:amidohydrolase [Anaerolineae bacterium]
MTKQIDALAAGIAPKLIAYRRDLHRYAESGWVEYRTASLVARRLADLGYSLHIGPAALSEAERMGLPEPAFLAAQWQRAREQGADPAFLEEMRGGMTGVVGELHRGQGPTVALRFDMDALDIGEEHTPAHRPFREGFASLNPYMMHACGHDAHTAIGLGVAEVLARLVDHLRGTLKLIFQPAEEGVRGAKAMVAAGVLDDVDYLVGHHVRSGAAVGEIACGMGGWAATRKFDAWLHGAPAHAGGTPQGGKNALLAAATAIQNLYAIARHADGSTRVNVGRLEAGTGRNVIPAHAHLVAETRGETGQLSDYVYARAMQILEAAAAMYGCELQVKLMGEAQTAQSDQELTRRVQGVAERMGGLSFFAPLNTGGSEDFTFMMRRVQQRGGLATSISMGADYHGVSQAATESRDKVLGAHTSTYDIDERVLEVAVRLLSAVTLDLMGPWRAL